LNSSVTIRTRSPPPPTRRQACPDPAFSLCFPHPRDSRKCRLARFFRGRTLAPTARDLPRGSTLRRDRSEGTILLLEVVLNLPVPRTRVVNPASSAGPHPAPSQRRPRPFHPASRDAPQPNRILRGVSSGDSNRFATPSPPLRAPPISLPPLHLRAIRTTPPTGTCFHKTRAPSPPAGSSVTALQPNPLDPDGQGPGFNSPTHDSFGRGRQN
jgi:hypothetical protein